MRRPPSYSDSFLIKPYSINEYPILEPLAPLEPLEPPFYILFIMKCSLHILFISSFESIFYFLYVSVSENTGILKVIDVYYDPIVNHMSNWSNTSKLVILDILNYEINKTAIDNAGFVAFTNRNTYNNNLVNLSIIYSFVFLFAFTFMCFIIYIKKIKIKWKTLFIEHLTFICLLALYEYFFYVTIIYKYTTISTDELNQYIVDGIYKALMPKSR